MRLGEIAVEAGFEGFGLLVVGADDEDGVVAGDGADDLGPVFVVDAGRYGLGAAGGGDEDEEVQGEAGLEAEVAEHLGDAGHVVFRFAGGRGVAGGALDEAQLAGVAGEGGLGDVDAAGSEFEAQIVLAGDVGFDEDFAYCGVTLLLHAYPFSRT